MKRPEYPKASVLKKVITGIVMLVVFVIALALLTGWTPSGHYTPGGGSVEITAPVAHSKIYIDNKEVTETKTANEKYNASKFSEKNHTIAVSQKGYWPWIKNIFVAKGKTVALTSFNLPQKITAKTLETSDSKYSNLWSLFLRHSPPDENSKITSSDGNYAIWSDGGTIFTEWIGKKEDTPEFFCTEGACATRIEVLNSTLNIDDVTFYPNRFDVLIFSNEDGIFAIEINKDGTQNFQPVLPLPSALLITSDNTLYIKAGDSIRYLEL